MLGLADIPFNVFLEEVGLFGLMRGLIFALVVILLFIVEPSAGYTQTLRLQLLWFFLAVLLVIVQVGQQFVFELVVGRTLLYLNLGTALVAA